MATMTNQTDPVDPAPAETKPQSQQHYKVDKLVIDTNAIVNGTALSHTASEFYTCPEVIDEVRSSHSREWLARFPYELKIHAPPEASVKAVIEFSKKTGDYASLSMPDIKVLALTHMLEIETNGGEGIRKEPPMTRPTGALPSAPPPRPSRKYIKAEVEVENEDDDGWEVAVDKKSKKQAYKKPARITKGIQNLSLQDNKTPAEGAEKPVEATEKPVENLKEATETTKAPVEPVEASAESTEASAEPIETPVENTQESTETTEAPVETTATSTENFITAEELLDDDDSDAGEWITPENLNEIRAKEMGVTPEELQAVNKLSVACMTSDFAMQNVLLQMNLNLVSAGGHRITKIKNWVLRCHACFTVTSNMEKKFCPKCGNATLQRVSCSTNSKGQISYHLKRGYQYNLRGTRYDIPRPQSGRYANNIVLREDQIEYIKAQQYRPRKKVLDPFDPDFIPLFGKTNSSNPGNNMKGTDQIGFGRRNPNASRKKQGKKRR